MFKQASEPIYFYDQRVRGNKYFSAIFQRLCKLLIRQCFAGILDHAAEEDVQIAGEIYFLIIDIDYPRLMIDRYVRRFDPLCCAAV